MATFDITPAEASSPPLCQSDILALAAEQVQKAVALADLLSQFVHLNQSGDKPTVLLYNETLPILLTMLSELLVEVEERIDEASQPKVVEVADHG